jgi:hypothetical protein
LVQIFNSVWIIFDRKILKFSNALKTLFLNAELTQLIFLKPIYIGHLQFIFYQSYLIYMGQKSQHQNNVTVLSDSYFLWSWPQCMIISSNTNFVLPSHLLLAHYSWTLFGHVRWNGSFNCYENVNISRLDMCVDYF